MRLRRGLTALAPHGWLRLPPRTARLRLTLLYGGLTLLLGTTLLAVTYLLLRHSATVQVAQAAPVPTWLLRSTPNGGARIVSPLARLLGAIGSPNSVAVQQRTADLGRLLEISWLELALTTLGSAAIGWFAAGRVLAPLRAITSTARTISAGSLHQRIAVAGPDDEFKRLGDTLDDLLARLEASFEAQRRFVANASHELRTPLAAERTMLQVALGDPDASAPALRAVCEEVLAAGAEQEALLEALLTLASSERGVQEREPLDLAALAEHALQAHRAGIDRLGLALQTRLAPAPTAGEPALVGRLIANLIDNAVDHNVPGGELSVRTATEAGAAVLTVANSGAHIFAEETERLLDPFARLAGDRTARTDGHHGLGLSIVRAIAAAHGAQLLLAPRAGGGLEVTVRFPAGSGDDG